jgi:hypothetical protein
MPSIYQSSIGFAYILTKLSIIYISSIGVFAEIAIKITTRIIIARIIATRIAVKIAAKIATRIATATARLLLGYRWYIFNINSLGLKIRTYLSIID